MAKKLLIVMNPVAGIKKANKFLTEIVSLFSNADYECQVQMSTKDINAENIIIEYGRGKDLIVCIGGDGTFNEVVSGCLKMNISPVIGYIPSGSTNDFAIGMNLSLVPLKAAKNILNGKVVEVDAGLFNGRVFTYTASFGAFTKASYNTPRSLKNSFGHFAYVLEGVKEITNLSAFKLQIKSEQKIVEGTYIYGGICNSKRIGGGLIQFSDCNVDMNDGLLEVFLIKQPKNATEYMQIIYDLNSGNFNGLFFEFFSTSKLTVLTDDEINWSIDGEFQKGASVVEIKNVKSAFKLLV